ncbi:hypothetical protein SAMN04487989_10231 [Bizionia echini]|uniref:Uncharacterized protein n=1 Tax=Bizionia echini TaxID=649333 RepID=A0A1I5AGB2_9FLAO|nr:hypothetical protein [Bizionia echini]SFN61467.1 hypothetical protein SAMN04487989_10231 [Bizionia echini]
MIKSHICDFDSNNKQLYHLTLIYKNCKKIYINDVLVPKQNTYLVSPFKESNSVKLKLVGLFNNQTHFLEVEAKPIDVNLPDFESRIVLNSIRAINTISHKRFNLSSLIIQK